VKHDLEGRVVLVTGALGNLGRATARAFHEAGARVALADRGRGRLAEGFAEWKGAADVLFLDGVDLADPASAEAMCRDAAARFGRLDVLVSTVGAFRGGRPVHEEDLATWDLLLGANLRATLLACRAAVPLMRAQRSGRIVTTAAQPALAGEAGLAAYAASKAAVLRLTESLAAELRGTGVTANCILPATLDTPANRDAGVGDGPRLAPEAVADVILFLASSAGRALTGAALPLSATGAE
jgi:NAD(P)-dependent dehydrogenase (short-subunit alcohol dehydrogenase family)